MRLAFAPYILKFKIPAGTSRGVMNQKLTYFIKIFDENNPEKFGIGEAAVFQGLSPEANEEFEYKLNELSANVAIGEKTDLSGFSSIQYGFEQAVLNFSSGGNDIYFSSGFTDAGDPIVINGLIWMGAFDKMIEQIDRKIDAGFHCIKLKIGAIDWYSEEKIIELIRKRFSKDELELRVDANGAFNMDNALPRLDWLAKMGVHSIEQPIPAGNYELMRFLCDTSPLPIALDEDLIGIADTTDKINLLKNIKPSYIILKPALCGGFSGATEWIGLARQSGIGWWVTSALESNIGLNALAQWTATFRHNMPQGLGTGALYTNNFKSPIFLEGETLKFNPALCSDKSEYDNLEWRQ